MGTVQSGLYFLHYLILHHLYQYHIAAAMRSRTALALLYGITQFASAVLAANSFTGANNYYAYALPQAEQMELLQAMSNAGMKVSEQRLSDDRSFRSMS
jgi:hypothetical protein